MKFTYTKTLCAWRSVGNPEKNSQAHVKKIFSTKNRPIKLFKSITPRSVTLTVTQPDSLENLSYLNDSLAQILLGETKYYEAKLCNESTPPSLMIEEVPTVYGTKPTISTDAIHVDVWGDTPGTKLSGDKVGVYWEKKYPDWSGNTFLRMAEFENDDCGLIRLVGRYFDVSGNTSYKVILRAKLPGGAEGTMTIEVKKPDQLFDPVDTDPDVGNNDYRTTIDVRNETLNIDSLAICWGGNIGIPPQVVKAQMFQESYKLNNHFYPSYRYEPWKDFEFQSPDYKYRKSYLMQPFFIVEEGTEMGEGKAIPGTFDNSIPHYNVRPISYPTEKKKIYEFAIENWQKYFATKSPLDNSEIPGNKYLTKLWRESYTENKYFYTPWYGGVTGFDIATSKAKAAPADRYTYQAQTRKAASYGFIQMMYTTAIIPQLGFNAGRSIESSNPPEDLNDQVIEMPFYHDFILKNLQRQFGSDNSLVPIAKWPHGWEQTWIKSFELYNTDENYGTSVFKHARKFYPQSIQ